VGPDNVVEAVAKATEKRRRRRDDGERGQPETRNAPGGLPGAFRVCGSG
jgi:hypothetical protein